MHEHFAPTLAAARARIAAVRPSAYAATRNRLDGAVTGLSPYITHGFVSLHEVLAGVAARHRLDAQHKLVYELGWRAEITPRFDVSLSAFYHDYDHLRGLSLTPRTLLPLVYSNSLEGETHGAELQVDYRPLTRWQLAAGLSLLREDIRVRAGRTDFFNAPNNPQFNPPANTIGTPQAGRINSTRFSTNRQIQFVMKFFF